MADSIYDQVLTIAYPQIQTLADAIEAYMTQEVDLAPRRFDWEDIQSHSPGLSLRWSPDAIAPEITKVQMHTILLGVCCISL